ncbi:hypothetical protein J2X76_003273 [Neorhizobium sp. 2083]|nr:hypothetical protein [Neorhizobium sp. 2083]
MDRATEQLELALEDIEAAEAEAINCRCDHLPLYRQSEIYYAREGVDLSRSTMAAWIGKASTLLEPLLVKLREHVFAGHRLHGDETPVPVLEPGKGNTRTGGLWTYVRDGRPYGDTIPPAVC